VAIADTYQQWIADVKKDIKEVGKGRGRSASVSGTSLWPRNKSARHFCAHTVFQFLSCTCAEKCNTTMQEILEYLTVRRAFGGGRLPRGVKPLR
jgi:hypothetical protein